MYQANMLTVHLFMLYLLSHLWRNDVAFVFWYLAYVHSLLTHVFYCVVFSVLQKETTSKATLFWRNVCWSLLLAICQAVVQLHDRKDRIVLQITFNLDLVPKKGSNSFACYTTNSWNSLPIAIKECKSLTSFKATLKGHLQAAATRNWE